MVASCWWQLKVILAKTVFRIWAFEVVLIEQLVCEEWNSVVQITDCK
jgi:hypothetical protein